jgi:hypothetical protein
MSVSRQLFFAPKKIKRELSLLHEVMTTRERERERQRESFCNSLRWSYLYAPPTTLPLRCFGKETLQPSPDKTIPKEEKRTFPYPFLKAWVYSYVSRLSFIPVPSSFLSFPSPCSYLCSSILQIFAFLGERSVTVQKSCDPCWLFWHSDWRCMSCYCLRQFSACCPFQLLPNDRKNICVVFL